MEIHKCKEILDICPIPYIWGKYTGDIESKSTDYIIKGGNDLLFKKLNIENEYEIINKDLTSVLGMSKEELNLFSKEKDGKFTKYQYVCNLKDTYKITLNIVNESVFLYVVSNL
ncbi:MAG: hypothetical protein E7C86_08185 [Paeniclostridium sordellii]|uniref:Uncharacterized protein n=1 Tax=Paeniclostridium hominis TaxID=2764329 RepID=A0ABR7K030_9FIRM|nr:MULTISPECIES: hypothetical protein [Paeniclostridium]MBC6002468.1 hypothetical protein [Paeniclostridium hominis]MDU2592577.1 hypothetical protein [Paeniclostridium sordellii]